MQRHVFSVLSFFILGGFAPLSAAPAHVPQGKRAEKHHSHSPYHHNHHQRHAKTPPQAPQVSRLSAATAVIDRKSVV